MQLNILRIFSVKHLKKSLLTLVLALFAVSFSFAQFDIPEIPKKQTSIYDYVGLLSSVEKNSLEQKLITYSDTTSTQIVVAIIGSTNGENIGLLTPRWAHKWGIGQAKEDNGVFVLLARDDRQIWISPGYGVEDRLTAGIVGEIVRNVIIPEFKKGDYYQGLNQGSDAIFEVLTGAYKGTRKADKKDNSSRFFFILIVVIFIIIALSKNKRNGGNNGRGGNRHGGFDIWDAIILSNMGRGGFGGSSGGGFSGGGSFGGGFGGGGFSGGGAGGSW